MSNPIRVLIVDDHPLMRQAIRTAIIVEPDLQIAGEASNGQEAIERARALQPDVTIMDLLMPGKDGLQAIAEIRAENPDARIIVLTSLSEEEPVVAAINAGAQGYLLKDIQRDDLLRAIREVAQGNTFLPPAIARKLIDGIQQSKAKTLTAPVEPLTERERAVLKLIGQGASNRDIAQKLTLTEGTVRTHVHNILGKLGLKNRNQIILYAVREGLVDK